MTTATEPADPSGFAVRLTATLPKGDANGLRELARLLVQYPREVRVAVVAFDTARVIDDLDAGTDTAVVRILRVEPLTDADAGTARTLLAEAASKRTGSLFDPAQLDEWVTGTADDDTDGGDE